MSDRDNPPEEGAIRIEGDDDLIPLDEPAEASPTAPEPQEQKDEEEPIRLVDDDETDAGKRQLKAIGAAAEGVDKAAEFSRAMNLPGTGATRCRIFSSKIQHSSLAYMENHINRWLDDDQIEIKHVGHVIGTMEGKRPEPNVIVMVWY